MAAVLLMVGRGQEAPAICTTLLDITLVNAKPQYNLASEVRSYKQEAEVSA